MGTVGGDEEVPGMGGAHDCMSVTVLNTTELQPKDR